MQDAVDLDRKALYSKQPGVRVVWGWCLASSSHRLVLLYSGIHRIYNSLLAVGTERDKLKSVSVSPPDCLGPCLSGAIVPLVQQQVSDVPVVSL